MTAFINESLARGYALEYIKSKPPFQNLLKWHSSSKPSLLQKVFHEIGENTNKQNYIKRIERLTTPAFSKIQSLEWRRESKVLLGTTLSQCKNSFVFTEDENFEEQSIFLNNIILLKNKIICETKILAEGNISLHAIARMFQRGCVTKENCERKILEITQIARSLKFYLEKL